jgi:hypothetical protein
MKKLWFEEDAYWERRKQDNRLKRISQESEQQDESRIDKWLELAKKLFDGDDDPSPSAA